MKVEAWTRIGRGSFIGPKGGKGDADIVGQVLNPVEVFARGN